MFIRFYSIINEYSIIKNKKRNGNEFYKYVLYILIYAFNILIIHCLINITGTVIKSVIKYVVLYCSCVFFQGSIYLTENFTSLLYKTYKTHTLL